MTYGVRLACVPVPSSSRVCEGLARHWLADRELEQLATRAVAKRRSEFVAGRVAAKTATARLCGMSLSRDAMHTLVAVGECAGQPMAVDRAGRLLPDVHLSITHSHGVAIAAAATAPIGIDLTPIETRVAAFDEEAFLPYELDDWRRLLGGSAEERLRSVAFAAKEAALKWRGVGLRAGLHDVRVTPTMVSAAAPCADLRMPARRLTVRVQVRSDAAQPVISHWRTRGLHGLLADLDEQVFVSLGARAPDQIALRAHVRVG